MADSGGETASKLSDEQQVLELQPGEEDQQKIWDQLKGSGSIFEANTAPLKSWPELVGLAGEEAKAKILAGNPHLQVFLVPEDSFVTMDYRSDRVRVFLDSNGQVARAPKIG